MAGGRNPQFSLEDLLEFANAMFGSPTRPADATTAKAQAANRAAAELTERYVSPKYFGEKGNVPTMIYDYVSPMGILQSGEETKRVVGNRGLDRGNIASLLIGAGLLRANKIPAAVRGAARAYRGTKDLFRDSGMSPQRAKLPASRSIQSFRE